MRRALLLLVVALVAVAACGVPADSGPRDVAAADVPFDLLAPADASPANDDATGRGRVYFRDATRRLVWVSRDHDGSAAGVLEALLRGPTPEEQAEGIGSSIPAGTQLLGVSQAQDVLVIDLSEEALQFVGDEQIVAFAQLVWTATTLRDVQGVQLTIAGQPTPMALGDGTPSNEPVTRQAYEELAPSSEPTPTTLPVGPEATLPPATAAPTP